MEKPILFSTEMVRAILKGQKTQTRRVIKPQPPDGVGRIRGPELYEPAKVDRNGELVPGEPVYGVYDDWGEWGAKFPYGQPGDVLWVRETWCNAGVFGYVYRATDSLPVSVKGGWRPSIHMPREAARLFLLIKNVRVERLQDITEEDARAEGAIGIEPISVFMNLWNSINGKRYPWESNPWVWVIEFERYDLYISKIATCVWSEQ